MYRTVVVIICCSSFWSLTVVDTRWLDPDLRDDICLTKECIISAAKYAEHLDLSVNPCRNFYRFACGGFLSKTLSTEGTVHVDTLIDMTMKAQLKKLLHKPKYQLHPRYYKMKEFYDSCRNTEHIEQLGVKPLQQLLDKYGGWPLLKGSKWDDKTFDWVDTLFRIYGDGLNLNDYEAKVSADMLEMGIAFNFGQVIANLQVVPWIKFPGLSILPRPNMTNVRITESYRLSVELAVLLGANRETAEDELEETYNLRNMLYEALKAADNETEEISFDGEMRQINVSYVRDLYFITDKIDWLPLLKMTFSKTITMDSEIVIMGRSNLFPVVLDILLETPKRIIANLLIEVLARHTIGVISNEKWRQIKLEFDKTRPKSKSRWVKCLRETHDNFLPILTAMYARNHYTPEDKHKLYKMFSLIQTEFRKILQNIDWLTTDTLKNAHDRLDEVLAFLAYPEDSLNDEKLESYYQELTILPDEFFDNFIKIKKFIHGKRTQYLGNTDRRTHWDDHGSLLNTNAYYKGFYNTIEIPPSQAREMYYVGDRLQVLNYGSLGSIMGHELLHAFNEIGVRQIDLGLQSKWWTEEDNMAYRNRAKCVIEQYDNYKYPRIGKLNGTNTLDENVSDNNGILIAYRAYQAWVAEYGTENRLPGLAFNTNQLFWIAYANAWCTSYAFYRAIPSPTYLSHSWPEYRVIGSVSNSKEFSEDFNCPVGSPMNPVKKCSVW